MCLTSTSTEAKDLKDRNNVESIISGSLLTIQESQLLRINAAYCLSINVQQIPVLLLELLRK